MEGECLSPPGRMPHDVLWKVWQTAYPRAQYAGGSITDIAASTTARDNSCCLNYEVNRTYVIGALADSDVY